jgi:TRAP-type mannitol/chloroaromatic compound transport system substrate-binding protein
VSGAIDATEWVGPWNDEAMKFQEAAKYYYYPGMHEPGSTLACGVNKSWFTSLSKSDQLIIKTACDWADTTTMAEYNAIKFTMLSLKVLLKFSMKFNNIVLLLRKYMLPLLKVVRKLVLGLTCLTGHMLLKEIEH